MTGFLIRNPSLHPEIISSNSWESQRLLIVQLRRSGQFIESGLIGLLSNNSVGIQYLDLIRLQVQKIFEGFVALNVWQKGLVRKDHSLAEALVHTYVYKLEGKGSCSSKNGLAVLSKIKDLSECRLSLFSLQNVLNAGGEPFELLVPNF